MSEFFFKNLSAKLFPAEAADDPGCLCCSYEFECGDCTDCTDTPTAPPCGECTDTPTGPPCGPCTDGQTEPPGCDGCTGTPTDDCFPCTDFDTGGGCVFPPVTHLPDCDGDTVCTFETNCIDTIDIVLPEDAAAPLAARPPDMIRQEMAALRAELRRSLGRAPEPEPSPNVGRPRTVEELDQLRDAMLGAVAELDAQRAELEGAPPPE